MHKNTRLLPYQRRDLFSRWKMGVSITVLVGLLLQVLTEREEIVHETHFERLDVLFVLFPLQEFLPSLEKILDRYDIIVSSG